MKVYVDPIPGDIMSRAMTRVANALREHAPFGVKIVDDVADADLQVIHVIGPTPIRVKEYAVIQYCWKTIHGHDAALWSEFWRRSRLVWSYYPDLPLPKSADFYLAPLGVDGRTFVLPLNNERSICAMTSGFVSRLDSEAIEEVAEAAHRLGQHVFHLGPRTIQGMKSRKEETWHCALDISDDRLAEKYRQTRWVSGLRQREGFELPVIEGLASGARPVVFDRTEMRLWYDGHAMFVPECHGEELIERLMTVFQSEPTPVSSNERLDIVQKFSWPQIARGFWDRLLGDE